MSNPSTNSSANSPTTVTVDTIKTDRIKVPADTHLTYVALLKKGWEETQKIQFDFENENATLIFLALIIGRDQNKFPFETISNHEAPRNNAYYHVRSVMFDKSQVDYTGRLNIKPQAQITDCYLAHHTLMLSRDAKVKTIPSLEIEADDVKAGHAATIGRVDDDLLFYFQSRGLDKKPAQTLLVKGFLEADLKKIPDKKARKKIAEEISRSL